MSWVGESVGGDEGFELFAGVGATQEAFHGLEDALRIFGVQVVEELAQVQVQKSKQYSKKGTRAEAASMRTAE